MRLSPWILGAFALAFVAGCTGGGNGGGFSSRTTEGSANTLTYPIANNPTTMDPHLVQDGDTIDILQQMYEGLVGWDENNEVTGLVAESWEWNDEGTEVTFKIREGMTFHNGQAVTADDVVWSLERVTNPDLASPVASAYLDDIVGVEEKVAGTAETISGLTKVDDMHVKLTLKKPTPYFLGKFTYLGNAVLPQGVAPATEGMVDQAQMIGTGPFKIDQFLPEQKVRMVANDAYWGGRPSLDAVERLVLGDAQTRLNSFKTDQVDLVQLERQDVASINEDPELKDQLVFYDRPAIWYIGLNQVAYEPFKNRDVRRAFAMAINRERIVNEVLGGVNTLANGIVPPGVPGGGRDGAVLPFDPEAARALLAEAGYPGGEGLPPLDLTFRDERPDIRRAAEAAATDLQENLGIEIKLQAQEWGAYLTKYNNREHTIFHMRWAADYLDPQNFLSHMLATWGPENKIGYNSSEFDRLCAEADRTMDMDARLPLYAQAEDTVLQDVVWIPLYFQKDVELHKPHLGSMRESLFGHLPHTTASISSADAE